MGNYQTSPIDEEKKQKVMDMIKKEFAIDIPINRKQSTPSQNSISDINKESYDDGTIYCQYVYCQYVIDNDTKQIEPIDHNEDSEQNEHDDDYDDYDDLTIII